MARALGKSACAPGKGECNFGLEFWNRGRVWLVSEVRRGF